MDVACRTMILLCPLQAGSLKSVFKVDRKLVKASKVGMASSTGCIACRLTACELRLETAGQAVSLPSSSTWDSCGSASLSLHSPETSAHDLVAHTVLTASLSPLVQHSRIVGSVWSLQCSCVRGVILAIVSIDGLLCSCRLILEILQKSLALGVDANSCDDTHAHRTWYTSAINS